MGKAANTGNKKKNAAPTHVDLKVRHAEEEAQRARAAAERLERYRDALAFVSQFEVDLRKASPQDRIEVTRVTLTTVATMGDATTAEFTRPINEALTNRVFGIANHPKSKFTMKRVGFNTFVLVENDAMRRHSLTLKTLAIEALWDELENGWLRAIYTEMADTMAREGKDPCDFVGAEVQVTSTLMRVAAFLADPDETLPDANRVHDAKVREKRATGMAELADMISRDTGSKQSAAASSSKQEKNDKKRARPIVLI